MLCCLLKLRLYPKSIAPRLTEEKTLATILDNFWFCSLENWRKKEWKTFNWQWRKIAKEKNEETRRRKLHESLGLEDCVWKDLKLKILSLLYLSTFS